MKEPSVQSMLKELINKVRKEVDSVHEKRGFVVRRIRPVTKDEIEHHEEMEEIYPDAPEPSNSAWGCDFILYFLMQHVTRGVVGLDEQDKDYFSALEKRFDEAIDRMDDATAEGFYFAFQCGLRYGELKQAIEYSNKHSRSDQEVWEIIYYASMEGLTDGQIAIRLNDLGYRKKKGKKFTREDVKSRRTSRNKNGKDDT